MVLELAWCETFVVFRHKSYIFNDKKLTLRKREPMAKKATLPKQTHKLTPTFDDKSRIGYRQGLSRLFLAEDPGTETYRTEYIYYVEEDSADGTKVYLVHPAFLNNGFDFTIHIENQVFVHSGKRTYTDDIPAHDHIVNDLLAKKEENPSLFKQLKTLLDKVFQCSTIEDNEYKAYPFKLGLSVETLFKTIKWFFVEQDITYWNGKGRRMLYYEKLLPLWEQSLWEQE